MRSSTSIVAAVLVGASLCGVHAFFIPPSPLPRPPPPPPPPAAAAAAATTAAAAVRQRGGVGMLLNLNKKDASTAPPFATEGERERDPGIKVSPAAWKWPKSWPYNADYFSRKSESSVPLNGGTPDLSPVYDEAAAAAVAGHYKRHIPKNGAVLELGASAHSYLPEDLPLSRVVGVGVNEEELAANAQLTERQVLDLNAPNFALPFPDASFDAVLMANTVEFLVRPREVFREAWRCLKPNGVITVSFASKTKGDEDRQIKIWGTMNNDQRIWIVGSFLHFACDEGFTALKGYDLSAADAKGMMAGLSGKTPLHIVQATKAPLPAPDADALTRMRAALWTSNLEQEDKALCLARMHTSYRRAETDEEREQLVQAVSYLPRLYAVLQEMGSAIPGHLKALLAVRIAERFHDTDEEVQQLRQGLGLDEPSESFWAPLGKMTGMMNAEDKVLLLGECVPMHAGTAEERQALVELIAILPQAIEQIKQTCPDMSKTDAQTLAVDLCVSDFLHEPSPQRASFLDWVKGLNAIDLEGYLEARRSYKTPAPAAAEI